MGRVLVTSSSIGVVLSLVLITLGMMATGQVWQSALGLGIFIAGWGGLGFGSMVGGVIYLTRLEEAAKVLEAGHGVSSPSARSVGGPPAPEAGAPGDAHAVDAA